MIKLLITPDDAAFKSEHYSFLVYDLENKQLIHKKEKINELDCLHLQGQGRHTFRPFGIECNDEYIYIASNDRLGVFDKHTFEFISLIDVPLYVNTHQILINNDTLYTCNTSVDSIGIYNQQNKQFNLTTFEVGDCLPTPQNVESNDKKHVNSLCAYEGKIYFCLHNLNESMSKFGYFDESSFECIIIANAGYCCHGIKIIDNILYSLSSGTGDIVEINLTNNEVKYHPYVDPKNIFLRGLDVAGDYLVFGCSNNHNNEPKENNCFISLYNTKTNEINRVLGLPDIYVITDLKIV